MSRIQILPEIIASQIAAGEVIQRPASVLKELIENSLDAGASHVVVSLEEGGNGLIRVADDGCGMTAEELPISLRRHATSKIRLESDLLSITTHGFRGEALAAIASVSQLEMLSRPQGENRGHRLFARGGEVISIEPCATPPGTVITISDIFFNTPARRKFLKSPTTEMDRSMDVFLRTSLDYPDIHFELNHHGKAVRHLPPVPGTIDRLLQVWNPRLAEDLLMVDYCTERIQIQGFIGRPSFHRKTAAEMYFYVNHRFVKDRLLMRATTEAYRASLPQRRYPFVILFVKVASEEVDVNVHPAKEEIRFRDEKSVWSALYHALRDTLSGLSQEQTPHPVAKFQDETFIIPAIRQGLVEPVPFSDGSVPGRMESESTDDFPIPDAPPFHSTVDGSDIPLIVGAQFIAPISGRASPAPTVNDCRGAATSTRPSFPPPTVTPCLDRATTEGNQTPVEMLGRLEDLNRAPLANPLASQSRQNRTEFSDEAKLLLTVKGQIFKTYILCETEDEVLIFDQHALHERILFEKFRKAWENHTPNPQELLFPQTIDIPRQFQGTFQGSQDLFTELGFELDLFGADSVVVRQIPSDMKLNEIQGFIEDVLHDLYQQGGHAQMTDRAERVLARMACRSAVKAGDPLSISEMQNLVDQYTFNPSLSTCPHGRRPVWRMSHRELERMFDRP